MTIRQHMKSTLIRAQVRAELLEARRLGVLRPRYDDQMVQLTPAQADVIRQAGLRAIGTDALRAQR